MLVGGTSKYPTEEPLFQISTDFGISPVSKSFFKTKMDKGYLQNISSVYKPGEDHSWGANLAWMLAHIRKGNSFIVCSSILEHPYRTGTIYTGKNIPSAFAREICIALKAGYILEKDETGSVQLKPPSNPIKDLKNLDTTGILGDGINPTYEEINQIFELLRKIQYDKQKKCQCFFQFENGKAITVHTLNATFDYKKLDLLRDQLVKGYTTYKNKKGEPLSQSGLWFNFTQDKFKEDNIEVLLATLFRKEDFVIKNDNTKGNVLIRSTALKKISNNNLGLNLDIENNDPELILKSILGIESLNSNENPSSGGSSVNINKDEKISELLEKTESLINKTEKITLQPVKENLKKEIESSTSLKTSKLTIPPGTKDNSEPLIFSTYFGDNKHEQETYTKASKREEISENNNNLTSEEDTQLKLATQASLETYEKERGSFKSNSEKEEFLENFLKEWKKETEQKKNNTMK